MAVDLDALLADLQAETDVVLDLVAGLDDAGVATPTPAEGWTIRDQLTHLAYFDEAATLSAVDPDRFRRDARELLDRGDDFPDQVAAEHARLSASTVRAWLVRTRAEYIAVFSELDPATRLPWFGPDMSAASSATARLMETWAHGQDVVDALEAPSGARWTWGPGNAADRVTGTALDFCLLVTQRRHLDDTDLVVTGPTAGARMSIAQAFAGAAADGPPRRQRRHPRQQVRHLTAARSSP